MSIFKAIFYLLFSLAALFLTPSNYASMVSSNYQVHVESTNHKIVVFHQLQRSYCLYDKKFQNFIKNKSKDLKFTSSIQVNDEMFCVRLTGFSFDLLEFYDIDYEYDTSRRGVNWYSYTKNPIMYTDPTGYDEVKAASDAFDEVAEGFVETFTPRKEKFTSEHFMRMLNPMNGLNDFGAFIGGSAGRLYGGIENYNTDSGKTDILVGGLGVASFGQICLGVGQAASSRALSTGGRQVPKWKWGKKPIAVSEAEAAYSAIRASKTDVASIARYNKLKPDRIQKIKDYLFNSAEFVADEQIAAAWHRLRTGSGTAADRVLLKHETAEMFLKSKGYPHSKAHNKANKKWNWQNLVQPPGVY